MSKGITRRDFVKQAAVGVSAAALAAPGTARAADGGKIRLGWIGMGGRAKQLMPDVLARCPDAVTVAVCDLIPQRIADGQKLAERDQPAGYTDYRLMLDKEKLDGVLICTTPNTHGQITIDVLEAGVHCFCEKPMETTVEKVEQVARAARKVSGKVIYQIGTQRRFHPTHLACVKAIHEGMLGKVTFMEFGWHWSWSLLKHPMEERGGMFLDQSVHHFDVMAWIMGDKPPTTCVAMGYNQNPQPEGPNAYSATHTATVFQFPPEGALASYTHLFYLPGKYDEERLIVFGEKGAIDINQGMYFGRDEKQERLGPAIGKGWNEGTPEELVDFVANIKAGGTRIPAANVETGRVATLMGIMGRMAHVNTSKNSYEPRVIHWKDLGSDA